MKWKKITILETANNYEVQKDTKWRQNDNNFATINLNA